MKYFLQDLQSIENTRESLSGVYTYQDLANLMAEPNQAQFYRRIKKLVENGTLKRFCRGLYITNTFDPEVLSQKLAPDSYISFGNILAEHLIIGTKSQFQVDAVKSGKTRIYESDNLRIRHFGTKTLTKFGIVSKNGIKYAEPERAILDTLYFYQHGVKFYYDIFQDIDWSRFDKTKYLYYLKSYYENEKFIKFAEDLINEST